MHFIAFLFLVLASVSCVHRKGGVSRLVVVEKQGAKGQDLPKTPLDGSLKDDKKDKIISQTKSVPRCKPVEFGKKDKTISQTKPIPSAVVKKPKASFSLPSLISNIQEVIDNTFNFSAAFQQKYWSKILSKESFSEGQVLFQKPGQMRWDYRNKEGKISKTFLIDGGHLWLVNFQTFQTHVNRCFRHDALSSTIAFLWGKGRLEEVFRISLLKQYEPNYCTAIPQLPAGGYCLQLVPKDASSSFAKLVIAVDKKSFRIVETVLIDHLSNRNAFVYDQMKRNVSMPKETFSFRPPKGMPVLPIPGSCLQKVK